MKRKFLFGLAAAIICCASSYAWARIVLVQEYNFDILDGLPQTQWMEGTASNECPADYPYPTETITPPYTGNNVVCKRATHMYGDSYCWKCTGPCHNENVWPYAQGDCDGLEYGESCEIFNTGEHRYKECLCPQGYYKKAKLSGGQPNTDKFTYAEPKTNQKGDITCYKPVGCASGKETIKKTEGYSITRKATGYEAVHGNDQCTALLVESALESIYDSNNFYCATGTSCMGPCKNVDSSKPCVKVASEGDNFFVAKYAGQGCHYYEGCKTEEGLCVSGEIQEMPAVHVARIPITTYIPSSNSTQDKFCYRASGCNYDVTRDYMYGQKGYSKEVLGDGAPGNGILETSNIYSSGIECAIYTCNSEDNWEHAGHIQENSTYSEELEGEQTPIPGEVPAELLAMEQEGLYWINYVQSSNGWFACKKDKAWSNQCFRNCSFGGWYNSELQDCINTGETTSKIFLQSDKNMTPETGSIVSLNNIEDIPTYEQVMAMNRSSYLDNSKVSQIAGQLLTKYGADHCYITKQGVVRIDGNGQVIELDSVISYDSYCNVCIINQSLFDGSANTDAIISQLGSSGVAAYAARQYYPSAVSIDDPLFGRGKWYLPSIGEWLEAFGSDKFASSLNSNMKYRSQYKALIQDAIQSIQQEGVDAEFPSGLYWSSSEAEEGKAWMYKSSNTSYQATSKQTDLGYVRPFMLLKNEYCYLPKNIDTFQGQLNFDLIMPGDMVFSDGSILDGFRTSTITEGIIHGVLMGNEVLNGIVPVGVVVDVSEDLGSLKVMALKDTSISSVIWGTANAISGIENYDNSSLEQIFSNMKNDKKAHTFCGSCTTDPIPSRPCKNDNRLYNGIANTNAMLSQWGEKAEAARATRQYYVIAEDDPTFGQGKWYLPAIGELLEALEVNYYEETWNHAEEGMLATPLTEAIRNGKLNKVLAEISGDAIELEFKECIWSSSAYDSVENFTTKSNVAMISTPLSGSGTTSYYVSRPTYGSQCKVRAFLLLENEFCPLVYSDQGIEVAKIGDIMFSDKSLERIDWDALSQWRVKYNGLISSGKVPVGVVAGISDDGSSIKIINLRNISEEGKSKYKIWDERFEIALGYESAVAVGKQYADDLTFQNVSVCRESAFCGSCSGGPQVIGCTFEKGRTRLIP